MKKLVPFCSFALIALITLIAFRYLFFLSYLRQQKSEFRAELIRDKHNEVTVLKISLEELFRDKINFEWKNHNKELVIEGKYHEVIKVEKLEKYALVYVIEDQAENDLMSHYFKLDKSKHNQSADLIKILLSHYYYNNSTSLSIRSFESAYPNHWNKTQITISSFKTKLRKPPKSLFS